MARRPRLFAPGLLYHVIVRGNQKQKTFLQDANYRAYLEVVNANNSPASLHDSAIKLQHFVESKITP